LQYDVSAVEARRTHPFGLGWAYLRLYGPVIETPTTSIVAAQASPTPARRTLLVTTWELQQPLDISLQQEISAIVTLNTQPLSDAQPELTLFYPDGRQEMFAMPPTGMNGQSTVRLPFLSAQNGDYFHYQVCVNVWNSNDYFCVRDSFVIWNNP
jgi:hypothetical protein